jgi:hypothetical protein
MHTDTIFGLLIAAAGKNERPTLAELAHAAELDPAKGWLTYALNSVRSYCHNRQIPDIAELVNPEANPETIEKIWAHDWTTQIVPPSNSFSVEHSPGIFRAVKLRRGAEAAYDAVTEALSTYWPKLVSIAKDRLGPAVADLLKSEETVERFAELTYPLLPRALQLFVREKDWVKFCVNQMRKWSAG